MADIQSLAAEIRRGKERRRRKRKKKKKPQGKWPALLRRAAIKSATIIKAITLSLLSGFAKCIHCYKERQISNKTKLILGYTHYTLSMLLHYLAKLKMSVTLHLSCM